MPDIKGRWINTRMTQQTDWVKADCIQWRQKREVEREKEDQNNDVKKRS